MFNLNKFHCTSVLLWDFNSQVQSYYGNITVHCVMEYHYLTQSRAYFLCIFSGKEREEVTFRCPCSHHWRNVCYQHASATPPEGPLPCHRHRGPVGAAITCHRCRKWGFQACKEAWLCGAWRLSCLHPNQALRAASKEEMSCIEHNFQQGSQRGTSFGTGSSCLFFYCFFNWLVSWLAAVLFGLELWAVISGLKSCLVGTWTQEVPRQNAIVLYCKGS